MKKMDEMEKFHTLQAIRVTFLYSLLFEVFYWIVECVKANDFLTSESTMFFLIITQGIVLVLTQLVLRRKVGDVDKRFTALFVIGFTVIFVIVGFLILKIGV